jgi:hypothetical protein
MGETPPPPRFSLLVFKLAAFGSSDTPPCGEIHLLKFAFEMSFRGGIMGIFAVVLLILIVLSAATGTAPKPTRLTTNKKVNTVNNLFTFSSLCVKIEFLGTINTKERLQFVFLNERKTYNVHLPHSIQFEKSHRNLLFFPLQETSIKPLINWR